METTRELHNKVNLYCVCVCECMHVKDGAQDPKHTRQSLHHWAIVPVLKWTFKSFLKCLPSPNPSLAMREESSWVRLATSSTEVAWRYAEVTWSKSKSLMSISVAFLHMANLGQDTPLWCNQSPAGFPRKNPLPSPQSFLIATSFDTHLHTQVKQLAPPRWRLGQKHDMEVGLGCKPWGCPCSFPSHSPHSPLLQHHHLITGPPTMLQVKASLTPMHVILQSSLGDLLYSKLVF